MNTTTEIIILPDEVIDAIKAFGNEAAKQKRLLAYALLKYMDSVPKGYHMQAYEMIAVEWGHVTGETVTGRTVRYWIQSVKTYTKVELQQYRNLTDAQLIEAVRLANDCQNGVTPQDICDWVVENLVDSVAAMRAEWLPLTGTPEATDPPALSGLLRWIGKTVKTSDPRWARIGELISELRSLLIFGAVVPEPPMVTEFQMLTGETEGEQG